MTLEEAKAIRAKAEAKRLRHVAHQQERYQRKKALLAEAEAVIAAAEKAANSNGHE